MGNNDCSVLVKEFPENRSAAHARQRSSNMRYVLKQRVLVYDTVCEQCVCRNGKEKVPA